MSDLTRVPHTIRIPPRDLEAIKAEARQRNMTVTDFMVRSATGRLEHQENQYVRRLDDLESRMKRLEETAFHGGF